MLNTLTSHERGPPNELSNLPQVKDAEYPDYTEIRERAALAGICVLEAHAAIAEANLHVVLHRRALFDD